MTRKSPKAAKEPVADKVEDPEKAASKKETPRSSNGYVEAKLKTRHCIGGRCKEAGESMRITRNEYARLKKYGRVE